MTPPGYRFPRRTRWLASGLLLQGLLFVSQEAFRLSQAFSEEVPPTRSVSTPPEYVGVYDRPAYFWGVGASAQDGDVIGIVGAASHNVSPLTFTMDPKLAAFLEFDAKPNGTASVKLKDSRGLLGFLESQKAVGREHRRDPLLSGESYTGRIGVRDELSDEDSAMVVVSLVGSEDVFDQVDSYLSDWKTRVIGRMTQARSHAKEMIDGHAAELLEILARERIPAPKEITRGWAFSEPGFTPSTLSSLVRLELELIRQVNDPDSGNDLAGFKNRFDAEAEAIGRAESLETARTIEHERTQWHAAKARIRMMPPADQVRAATKSLTDLQARLRIPGIRVPSTEEMWQGVKKACEGRPEK